MLALLREAWLRNTDSRLGQLVFNAARERDPDITDVFNIEDEVLRKGLLRYLQRTEPTQIEARRIVGEDGNLVCLKQMTAVPGGSGQSS